MCRFAESSSASAWDDVTCRCAAHSTLSRMSHRPSQRRQISLCEGRRDRVCAEEKRGNDRERVCVSLSHTWLDATHCRRTSTCLLEAVVRQQGQRSADREADCSVAVSLHLFPFSSFSHSLQETFLTRHHVPEGWGLPFQLSTQW